MPMSMSRTQILSDFLSLVAIFLEHLTKKMLSKDLGILSGVLRNSMIIFLHERNGPGSHCEEEVIGLLMDSML